MKRQPRSDADDEQELLVLGSVLRELPSVTDAMAGETAAIRAPAARTAAGRSRLTKLLPARSSKATVSPPGSTAESLAR